jgi:hypothetical protein
MGGGKRNGDQPRRGRRNAGETQQMLRNPSTAFCLPKTPDAQICDDLLDQLRESGL